jgi:hypothetical protein
MERRVFVTGLAVAAVGLTGCDDKPVAKPRTKPSVPMSLGSRPKPLPWHSFERSLDGDLLLRGERGYRSAKQLFNPRFDAARPLAVIRPGNTADVAEAIRFATQHHLSFAARSGGHSYVGASTVDNGVQLDLARMADVTVEGSLVHVGAGARLFDVHAALDAHGRSIPTGTCPTVGAAGLTLGGGVGVESRAHGLTCDALVEVEILTADGRVRTASATREPDLFWACQGGGGGSFGVVTRLTYKTFAAQDVGFFFLHFDQAKAADVVEGWLRRQAKAPRSSWSNVHLDGLRGGGIDLRIVGLSLTGDGHPEAAALERAIGVSPTKATFFTRNHHDATKLLAGCSTVSDNACHLAPLGTLAREAFAAGSDVVSPALSDAAPLVAQVRARGRAGRTGTLILDPLGGAVAASTEGAFPWRKAAAIAQWYVGLSLTPTSTDVASAYSWISGGHKAFGKDSMGGYVNYLEPARPLSAYFGASLRRLGQVKAAVDPGDFFHSSWSVPPR